MNGTETKNVRTRFAPSPTGLLHIGGARTALFNYLFAKQNGGKFILRIEDTDQERSEKRFEDDILDGLKWLKLDYDEIYHQSERKNIYQKYISKMLEEGNAYEAEKNELGTGNVIRFKNPNTEITFNDLIRGDITFNTTELKDFVIAKDINSPLYHLAVVADDCDMKITHIIRGEDHISNTSRQMLIQDAIGAARPLYAHIPLILAPDRSKLSKRHGAVSINDYKEYEQGAMLNFLALMGWNPGGKDEIFSIDELIGKFDIKKVQKGGAIFNVEKLSWINKEHLKKISEDEKLKKIKENIITADSDTADNGKKREWNIDDDTLGKIAPVIFERIDKWSDIREKMKEGEWSYFYKQPQIDAGKLIWKECAPTQTEVFLKETHKLIKAADFSSADNVKSAVWDYAEKEGRGNVLWPFRYALSGRDKSPDPFTLAYILGKDETLRRLQAAIGYIHK